MFIPMGPPVKIPRLLALFEKPIVPLLLFLLPVLFIPSEFMKIDFIWSGNQRVLSLATSAAIFAIVAYGLNILMRFAGLPSVVHGALWGMGAYTAGIIAKDYGWNYWAILPFTIIVPAVTAFVVGLLALRTSGIAFIVMTIALADFVVLVMNNDPFGTPTDPFTGGSFGLVVDGRPDALGPIEFDSPKSIYYLAIAFLFIAVGITYLISKSAFGRRLEAIRDNEALARSIGINAFIYKIIIFAVSAAIVGVAGQLFLYHTRAIQPSLFNTFSFINVLLMVVMGGMGVLSGPAIGAWVVTFLPEWLGPLGDPFGWDLEKEPNQQRIVFGVLLMAFMLLAPLGVGGTIKMWYIMLRNMIITRSGGGTVVAAAPTDIGGLPPISGASISEGNVGGIHPGAGSSPGPDPAPQPPPKPSGNSPLRPVTLGETILECSGVSKNFAAVQALREVDVSVRQGEILGIIGPNGSGKTTLFNCVSGFLDLSEGKVMWRNKNITGWAPDRVARHGLVRTFQQSMLFRSTTVRRSCLVALESLGAIGFREKADLEIPHGVDGILEFCDLTHVANQPAAMLPYGLTRKLGVAVALATSPHLLMLDEPAAGLNDIESLELAQLLLRARQAGVTLIVVDHDMPFLMPISDRLVVLDAGRKLLEGTPQQVQADERVIAAYLGERFAKMAAERAKEQ